MDEFIMDSYGKINLALDILYKRDDGYHEIRSIMQRIGLRIGLCSGNKGRHYYRVQ